MYHLKKLSVVFFLIASLKGMVKDPNTLGVQLITILQAGTRSTQADIQKAKQLINQGANVNMQDSKGMTPLLLALETGDKELITLVINKGADPNAYENKGGPTPLMIAANRGYEDIVTLLLDKGAHINYTSRYGTTPLIEAINGDKNNVVKLLLSRGASITGIHGADTLSAAVRRRRLALVQLLLSNGIEVNSINEDGLTPLIEEVKWGTSSRQATDTIIKMLIDGGANIYAKDAFGYTVFDYLTTYSTINPTIKTFLITTFNNKLERSLFHLVTILESLQAKL